MKLCFDNNGVLIIKPKDSKEAMALRWWKEAYTQHGDKMLHVDTEVPIKLPEQKGY